MDVPLLLKRVRQAGTLVTMIPQHRQYMKTLRMADRLGIVDLRATTSKDVRFKHLGRYLTRSISTADRLATLTHHYSLLCQFVAAHDGIDFKDAFAIWSDVQGDGRYSILLGPSTLSPMEGEHSLRFCAGHTTLFTLTFSFSRGELMRLPDDDIIVVGGAQGRSGSRDMMRDAARDLHEISPPHALVVALKALCDYMDISAIVGVGLSRQAILYAPDRIFFDYDRLWRDFGGCSVEDGYFVLRPDAADAPLTEVARSHRARTKRKRAVKKALRAEITANLCRLFDRPPSDPMPRDPRP